MTNTIDEYDVLVYPGFLRRNVAKWNEDGSFAPLVRARGYKMVTPRLLQDIIVGRPVIGILGL